MHLVSTELPSRTYHIATAVRLPVAGGWAPSSTAGAPSIVALDVEVAASEEKLISAEDAAPVAAAENAVKVSLFYLPLHFVRILLTI